MAVVTGAGAETGGASTAGIGSEPCASPDDGEAGLIRFPTSLGDFGERMTKAERAAAGPLVPMANVAATVIGADDLAGRVVLPRGGRPRRFLT